MPDRRVGYRTIRPRPVSSDVASAYEKAISAIWAIPIPADSLEIPFSKEADETLAEFESALEPRLRVDGDLGGLAAWGTKLAGEVARIAGTLEMAEMQAVTSTTTISAKAVRSAVHLATEYLIPHAIRAFCEMGKDPSEHVARRILDWVIRKPEIVSATVRDAFQALKEVVRNLLRRK